MANKEFPALVYKGKGEHQCAGGTYDYKQVVNVAEFKDALACGWYESLPDAVAAAAMPDAAKSQSGNGNTKKMRL